MFTSYHAYQAYENVPTESESMIENPPMCDHQKENLSVNYPQENAVFKGLLLALPVSISMWVIIIWGIKSLLF